MTTEHRAIVAVDIASFTDPRRTLMHLRTVQEGLYDMLRVSFDEAGMAWKLVYHEDRGDGAMILVPPEFPKLLLADQWYGRLLAALRRYNEMHTLETRVQLRVALHHGEVYANSDGVVSHAVNLAFRILDAKPAKSALAQTGGMLALIASNDFFQDVIAQEPSAVPSAYRRIAVSVKQTETVAWLRLPDVHVPPPAPPPPRVQVTPLSDIVDALLELPFVREANSRAMLIDLLPREIANSVPYYPITRMHVFALVQTCLRHERGLLDLIEAVRQLDGDSGGVRRLEGIKRLLLSDSVD
ncbi:effector-associated domain 2-containing protein [Kibdelosporangium aridum]|uniref:effector-associated domain 2-containing protein n=1 Tax=Kibdelosporangium aridum TaxID=2030 RepID=UPI000526C70B